MICGNEKKKKNNEENSPRLLMHAVLTHLKSTCAVYALCSVQLCVRSASKPIYS